MEVPVVSFIVNRLGVLLTEEAKFLYGVRNQVEQIRVELNRMQCFLQDADYAIQSDLVGAGVNNWITEVRKLAYETEDILETYVIQVSSKRNKKGFRDTLNRFASIFNEGQDVHRVGCEISAIKNKITDLTASLHTYGLKSIGEGPRSLAVEEQQELRQTYLHVVEKDFVGFEEDLNKVVKHLVQVDDNTARRRGVVSICGMGGLGKTTLAKKVYHHQDVQDYFDYLAWVCISQRYETRDILERIFIKLVPERKEDVGRMRIEELFQQLYEVQQSKKCLVVLDDIWSIKAWEKLEPAFPENTGSKILLTTRVKILPSQIDPGTIVHKPQYLNDEESWDLLQKKSLLKIDGGDSRVLDTNMEALGRKMVKLCAGLPLAIVVLGGLLARKHTLREWEMVYQNVRSGKWNDDPIQHDDGVSNVLALSYHDLPYQLKPCFLYFGHFPEDYEVDVERLYHLWIADGIIVDDDRVGDETIMDVAKRYLDALAQRCMVQVEVEEYTQRINHCRIHDLMLELCLSKAKMNDFLRIIHLQHETDLANCFSTTTSTTTAPKIRKLAIHLSRDVERVVLPELETTKHLRSILFCNSRSVYEGPSIELNSHLKYFKLLRNLDLEGFELDENSVKSIGNLISLRYLRFRDCLIPKWHSSICKLKHLQTLDLRDCEFNLGEVIVIHGMEQLRHLYIPFNPNVKLKFDGLSNLETLGGFNTRSCDVNDLCKLINLRQLEDATFLKKHNQDLAAFINYLSIGADHLRQTSLSVQFCKKEEEELTLLKQLLGCHHLYRLSIRGIIPELPEYCQGFSPNLIKLTLVGCDLEEDPMPTLERLPNLQYLDLGAGAFVGYKMVCSANGFPQLKTLYLSYLEFLKGWEMEKGAMPNLSVLEIDFCRGLVMVPEGLRFIATLQRFEIKDMHENFNSKLRRVNGEEGEDFYKVRHVSSLNIIR